MIYPVDKSKAAKKERDSSVYGKGYFHPDFEVDALLYVSQGLGEDIPPIPIRMEAELEDEGRSGLGMQFALRVKESSIADYTGGTNTLRHVNNGGYWATQSNPRDVKNESEDDWGILIPRESVEAMMVWLDQRLEEGGKPRSAAWKLGYDYAMDFDLDYRELGGRRIDKDDFELEAEAWFDSNVGDGGGVGDEESIAFEFWSDVAGLPGGDDEAEQNQADARDGWIAGIVEQMKAARYANDAEAQLRAAGLPVSPERTGGADWSVNSAWALGNNVYLVEEDNDDLWSIVRRDMASEDDEITELAGPGTLEEMITRAPRFL